MNAGTGENGGSLQIFLKDVFDLQAIDDIRVVALPLAYSVSVFIQFSLLLFFLRRRLGKIGLRKILKSSFKIFSAGILMAAIMLAIINFVSFSANLILLTMLVALVGAAFYLLLTYLFKSPELKMIFKILNN